MDRVSTEGSVTGARSNLGFLQGGGEMGRRMRGHDWSTSPLGEPDGWAQSLRAVVALMINSKYPMFVAWGADLAFLYNDGYIPIFGAKHPHTLGLPFQQVWSEIWDDISPLIDRALAGEPTFNEDMHLVMERHGYPEDTWYSFSYSPVRDETGAIAGMFCACTETTQKILAERSLRQQEAYLRLIFEQIDEGVIIADAQGQLTLVNQAAERLHGVKLLGVPPEGYAQTYSLFTEAREPYPSESLPLARAVRYGETVVSERWRIRRPDGSEVVAIGSARPLFDGDRQIGAALTVRDDTGRLSAENALRQSEERLRLVIDGATDYAIFTTDPDRTVTSWSKGAELAFGYKADEIIGRCADILWTPEDRTQDQPAKEVEMARRTGCANNERWYQRRDGSQVFMNGSVHPLPLQQDGTERGFIKIAQDETERRAADEKRRESEEFNRRILASSGDCIKVLDLDARLAFMSEGGMRVMEVDDFGLINRAYWPDFWKGEGNAQAVAAVETARNGGIGRFQGFATTMKGTPRWWDVVVSPINGADGKPDKLLSISRDITSTKQAETALRESEDRFRNMADNAPVMMWVTDADGSCLYLNRAWYEFTGQSENEALGIGWLDAVHPDDRGWSGEAFVKANADQKAFRLEYRLRRQDGAFRWAIDAGSPRFDRDGKFMGYVGSVIDIDVRREMEDALRISEERYRTLFDTMDEGFCVIEFLDGPHGPLSDYVHIAANAAYTEHAGIADVVGQRVRDMVPDEADGWVEFYRRVLVTGEPIRFERDLVATGRHLNLSAFRIEPPSRRQVAVLFQDQTKRKKAEDALKALNETLETRVAEEVARRNEAEDALRQSQKMETLGQLTGGIAHDFNNLLQVITGNLDIIKRTMTDDSPRLRRSIDNAAKGADRAAVLTQRLLAFSRRQPLAPKVIDANKLVLGMSEMLYRSLGETIELETVLSSGLWRVEVDPNQLENAILNLAVNSRDAMPEGGKMTVETANAHLDHGYTAQHSGIVPGQYVMICVSDTGSGMDAETAERAFDPFFTTKEVGKGTGLGLSMVYGFVKQSGGHLKIYSEANEGTTIKIYLPRHHGCEDTREDEIAAGLTPEGSESETILVCEDDDDVRAYSADTLRELGYRVVEAADGQEALRFLEEGEQVDLLFSDVVLPGGLTGAIVADRARKLRPSLKVLFTTGYARNAIVHHGRLDPGVELLSKPFSYTELAARIRELLDAD